MERRSWIWLQVIIGLLPVAALFAVMIIAVHANVGTHEALYIGFRSVLTAAVLGIPVRRFTQRVPWPRQLTARFLGAHLVAAAIYAFAWVMLNSLVEGVLHGHFVLAEGPGVGASLVMGVWLYVMLAGVLYAVQTTERAATAEAAAVSSTLAALRAQLHPHFLFNTLHTVIQLIPSQPKRAAQAAEQLADLLRHVLEHDRDLVLLSEERTFVEGYLAIERLRFGDRLRTSSEIGDSADDVLVPSFALLTLVENAVRHGAEPKIEPTDVSISARVENGMLTVVVRDTGVGAPAERFVVAEGTGLRRLRDRLRVLYAGTATLDVSGVESQGVTATLRIPVKAIE